MAIIRPFFCIRPCKEKASKIAALPYDVYNRREAKEEALRHPDSFLNIDRAETQFPDDVDMYDEKVYQKAHDMLWEKVADGTLVRDPICGVYVEKDSSFSVRNGDIVEYFCSDDCRQKYIKQVQEQRKLEE